MTVQLHDPYRAYAAWWAVHAERCPRCAGAGELAPDHLCRRGHQLLEAGLESEHVACTRAWGCKSRSFGDQTRINPEPAPG